MNMRRTPNRFGGGSQTNANGLLFEQTTSLDEALKEAGFVIDDFRVYKEGLQLGYSVSKSKLYSVFLKPNGIDYRDYNSKQWQPDECFINEQNRVAYIIEKKFQNTSGSVDEKLPGCHFKMLEYRKLFLPLGFDVEYFYVFNDWFQQEQYADTKEYIKDMGCDYFFNGIPLEKLGLEGF